MSGISSVLDIAAQAMAAEQVGVEVTSHNIANVNTPGYSRQKVNYVTAYPETSPWGPMGRGVRIYNIERSFDRFIQASLDGKTATLWEYQAKQSEMERVATIFNETEDDALNTLLSEFWAAWHDLADNPQGAAERQALIGQAESLCDAFSSRAEQLVQERQSITQEIGPILEEINTRAARIAELTGQIQESEVGTQVNNDLRDKRQNEITELEKLVGVSYYTTGDGTVNVTLPNGRPLVTGIDSWTLEYTIDVNDEIDVTWHGPGGTVDHISDSLTGGKLSGLIQVRDTIIPQYQSDLDNLAKEFIGAVNSQHSQGVGLELFTSVTGTYAVDDPTDPLNATDLPFGAEITAGTFQIFVDRDGAPQSNATIAVDPTDTLDDLVIAINTSAVGADVTASVVDNQLRIVANAGTDTFGFAADTSNVLMALGINTFFNGDSAYTFEVNSTVSNSPNMIAAGQIDTATGEHPVGDNQNALALSDLENTAVVTVGTDTLTVAEAYRRLVADIGLEAEQNATQAQFFQDQVDQYQAMRDDVSGVSLDEELTNLIKYQRAYQAAARLVTVADEMFQTLLNTKQ
ncbi:MAG: flagellar hook-associated protein FlgK [Thermodesulfobacteriota bacterium]